MDCCNLSACIRELLKCPINLYGRWSILYCRDQSVRDDRTGTTTFTGNSIDYVKSTSTHSSSRCCNRSGTSSIPSNSQQDHIHIVLPISGAAVCRKNGHPPWYDVQLNECDTGGEVRGDGSGSSQLISTDEYTPYPRCERGQCKC